MPSEAERYLRDNKDKFDRDALVAQLRAAGHGEESIANAVREVYGGAAGSPHYAGFWIRFVAVVVDGFVLIVPMGLIQIALGKDSANLANFINWVLSCVYYITMTHLYQATLGRMAVGIKVSGEDFTRLSLGKIILRETLLKILSCIILGIGFIMAGFTQKKQALHDLLVGSVVHYEDFNNPRLKKRRVITTAIVIPLFVAFFTIMASAVFLASLRVARDEALQKSVDAGKTEESISSPSESILERFLQ